MTKILISAACIAAMLVQAAPAEAATTTYKNCAALNKKFPHGVALNKSVKDLISGKATSKSVKTFKVSGKDYVANAKMDGDYDGVACEKK